MPIKDIKVILKIKTESSKLAEIIHTAINPDNLTEPPMTFHFKNVSSSLEFRINNVISVETILATLMDLLTVFQTAESALNTFSSETG